VPPPPRNALDCATPQRTWITESANQSASFVIEEYPIRLQFCDTLELNSAFLGAAHRGTLKQGSKARSPMRPYVYQTHTPHIVQPRGGSTINGGNTRAWKVQQRRKRCRETPHERAPFPDSAVSDSTVSQLGIPQFSFIC